jgi:hypothetical protein
VPGARAKQHFNFAWPRGRYHTVHAKAARKVKPH